MTVDKRRSVLTLDVIGWAKARIEIEELQAQRDSAIESNIAMSKRWASGDPESGPISLLYGQPLDYWLRMEAQRDELLDALVGISNWRKDCHAYDADCGYELRDFDIDDVAMIEGKARAAIAKAKGDT